MHSDRPLNTVGLPTHGGARAGSGQKPGGYVKPPEAVEYDKAKARSEIAKAEKLERENMVQEGLLVFRSAVQQAAATSYAALAQTMRTISDHLERQGVPTDVCVKVEAIIDAAMADHAAQMQLMAGTPEGPEQ